MMVIEPKQVGAVLI